MKKNFFHTLAGRILLALLALLLVVLIVLRLYLGVWLLHYVNGVLAHMGDYSGSVKSIDIDLYRGAYRLNDLVIDKMESGIPTPFVSIGVTDFSVEWRALLHGRVVADATLIRPVLTFAVKGGASQTGADVDWTKPIMRLTPVDIDYVRLRDGRVTYRDFSSTPPVDLYIRHLNGEVTNLRNIVNKGDSLPSRLTLSGRSIGGGALRVDGRLNILRRVPDMDLRLALERVDLPALNSYTDAYASFGFKSGAFDLYARFTARDGHVGGYIKPILTHLSVDVLKEPNPIDVAWRSIVAAVMLVFTNPAHDQFATQVDLDGTIGDIDTDTWSALIGILHNAFIKAISRGFDQGTLPAPQK